MRRKRTNVWVLPGGRGRSELERHRLCRLEQLRREENLRHIRYVTLSETSWRSREPITSLANRRQRPGCAEDEVVLHRIRIRVNDLDQLAGGDIQFRLVEFHLSGHDGEADGYIGRLRRNCRKRGASSAGGATLRGK